MQPDDKIKNIFSSKLKDFAPEVPDHVWEKMVEHLPNEVVVPRAKKVYLYKQLLAVAGMAAAVVICFVLFYADDNISEQISSTFSVEELVPPLHAQNEAEKETKEIPEVISVEKSSSKFIASASPVHTSIPIQVNISPEPNNNPAIENNQQNSSVADTDNDKATPVDEDLLKARIEEFVNNGNKEVFSENTDKKKKKVNRGFALSVNGNTGLSKDNNNKTLVDNPLSTFNSRLKIGTIAYDNKEVPVKMDHRQPISFGLGATKTLNNKLSVEVGVVYTYLLSKVKSDNHSKSNRFDTQQFHYLGVPVSLNYSFAQWGKADFYLSAGGMVQKDFYGRIKGKQNEQNFDEGSETVFKKEVNQKNFQFSLLGKIGGTYPIYNKLHIYTTVGGAYFIDAKNEYKTIYSDRKFQVDINVGLKIKF